jgi:ribonuclease E
MKLSNPKVLYAVSAILLCIGLLVGCGAVLGTGTQAQQQTAAAALAANANQVAAVAGVATQQAHVIVVAAPGTPAATQAAKVETVAGTIQTVAAQVSTAAATASTQPSPAATLLPVIIQTGANMAAPAAGPYAPLVSLGGYILGALVSAYFAKKAASNQAAASSMQSGIQAALTNGSLVATPQAAGTVDSLVTSHPTTDLLVDVITAAAKPAVVK